MEKTSRKGIVELWRFIACLLIMARHIVFLGGVERGSYNFWETWIYVEFFFILTGYFTFEHFGKNSGNDLNQISKNSIAYTYKKFVRFIPYTAIGVVGQYIIRFLSGEYSKIDLLYIPFNLFLLSSKNVLGLWFLIAMLAVFPIFCCICQMKSKNLLYITSFFAVTVYYDCIDSLLITDSPDFLLRALVGLLLGILVHGLVEFLNDMKVPVAGKVLLTVIEQGCMIFTVICAFCNYDIWRVDVLCFAIALIIMLSNQSYTCYINSRILDFLGQLSMVVYVVHSAIALCIGCFGVSLELRYKVCVYYLGTLLVAIILYMLFKPKRKQTN